MDGKDSPLGAPGEKIEQATHISALLSLGRTPLLMAGRKYVFVLSRSVLPSLSSECDQPVLQERHESPATGLKIQHEMGG